MGIHAPIPHRHPLPSNYALGIRVDDIEAETAAIIRRARAASELKARLVLKIPYHEWADALARKRTRDLIDAYTPRYLHALRDHADAPRCPPWASRNYRGAVKPGAWEAAARHAAAHLDRVTGEWGSLRASLEREARGDAEGAGDAKREFATAGAPRAALEPANRDDAARPGSLAASLHVLQSRPGSLSAAMDRIAILRASLDHGRGLRAWAERVTKRGPLDRGGLLPAWARKPSHG